MRFTTYSDMGSIKIHNGTMSTFFQNGYGDGQNKVTIRRKAPKRKTIWPKGEFLGHFTVKTEAYLSDYDCNDGALYTFDVGRWFVFRTAIDKFIIEKVDGDIHA